MSNINGIIDDGSIIVFLNQDFPAPFDPMLPSVAGAQPADQKLQGYPQMRGFLVTVQGFLNPSMGVLADENTQ